MSHHPRRHPVAAALLALSLAVAGAGAQAQVQGSGVQITGSVGVGVTTVSHQAGARSLQFLNDNLLSTSWLRITGNEDLGGGLQALFRLETGVGLDIGSAGTLGAANKLWNRQSWVGLRSSRWGQLTLGRQFHAATDRAIRTFDAYQLAGSSLQVVPLALFGVNRYAGNDSRADNAVKFRTAVPGVLELGVSAATGEDTSARSYSLDVAHVRDHVEVGIAYVRYNAPTTIAATGALPQHTVLSVGGNVALGPVRLYLALSDSDLDATVAGRLTQRNRLVAAGLHAALTLQTTLKAAWYGDKGTSLNGVAGRDGRKTTLVVSAHHALSRRTELYAAAFQNRFSDGYRQEAVNIAALGRDAAASRTGGVSLGVRHGF